MRIFTALLLIFIICQTAYSQSFRVDSETKYYGSVGNRSVATINIKNLTNKPLHLQIKRISSQLNSSQENYFCWGDECYSPEASSLAAPKVIEPSTTTSKFKIVLDGGLAEATSTVKYLIYNVNNPADSVSHEITYVIEDQNSKKILFYNKDVQISNIYPNPVVNFAFINYTLSPKKSDAKIVIHNVVGTIIAEYALSPHESKLKISTSEFNSGIYFYTLRMGNENLITKKLVIKR